MTRLQKALLSILLTVCFLAIVVSIGRGKWQKPLGPALRTATPFGLPATWTPDPKATKALQNMPTAAPVSRASPRPTLTANTGLCGAPPLMNILAIGADTRG